MTERGFQTGRAFIEMVVDADVVEFPVLEAGFMVIGMVMGKRCIVVAICPPDFSMGKGVMFLFCQG